MRPACLTAELDAACTQDRAPWSVARWSCTLPARADDSLTPGESGWTGVCSDARRSCPLPFRLVSAARRSCTLPAGLVISDARRSCTLLPAGLRCAAELHATCRPGHFRCAAELHATCRLVSDARRSCTLPAGLVISDARRSCTLPAGLVISEGDRCSGRAAWDRPAAQTAGRAGVPGRSLQQGLAARVR